MRPWDAPPPLEWETTEAGELVLTWAEGPAHELHCATNLVEPIQWMPATHEVTTADGNHRVAIVPDGGTKFFTLLEP